MPLHPTYREYPPSTQLAEYVACYWTARYEPVRRSSDVSQTDRVLPDACMDVLFDMLRGDVTLVGTMTRPLSIPSAGPIDLLGIRFRPGGIGAFVDLPAVDATDKALPLDVVWGARIRALAMRLPDVQTTAQRLALVESALRQRIQLSRGRSDVLARTAAGLVERAGGHVRIEALAHATGLGPRQLERRFLQAVGLPPKTACRIVRFQGAVARLHTRPGWALSRVALEAGYHDQAHFTREFRTFAGETPGAYRRRRGLDDGSVQDSGAPRG